MDQITGRAPTDSPTTAQDDSQPADVGSSPEPSGFGARGRLRRRARFLRKARELAYRDLGGLVFSLHRFGQRNDSLVVAKLTMLGHIDAELRSLESALEERQPVTVLREAGITACPRCAAIHGSEDRFCPNCGLAMGRHADLPIGVASATAAAPLASPTPVDLQAAPTPAPLSAQPARAPTKAAETPPPSSAGSTAAFQAPAPIQEPTQVSEPEQAPTPSPGNEEVTEILHPPATGQ